MGDDGFGLFESISMALGGMIGGGIFAVLGVVASTSGSAAWMAFIAAGIIALCSGAATIALNDAISGHGGPITYIQQFTGQSTIAGMAGWTFTVGYIGTSAMYAFAFGSYLVEAVGMHTVEGSRPARSCPQPLSPSSWGSTRSARTHPDVLRMFSSGSRSRFCSYSLSLDYTTGS